MLIMLRRLFTRLELLIEVGFCSGAFLSRSTGLALNMLVNWWLALHRDEMVLLLLDDGDEQELLSALSAESEK